MSNMNCNCRSNCIGITAAASILIGVIVGLLRFMAVITVAPALLWIAFGTAIVYLAITFIASASAYCQSVKICICSALPALLTGVIGTIITSIILLVVEFAATSIIGAVITGILALFFTLTVGSIVCATKCAAGCDEG